MSRFGKLTGVLLALPLVPTFFVLEHVGVEGFPEALGCSGAGGIAPLTVAIPNPLDTPMIEVGSDVFFPLMISGAGSWEDVNVSVKKTADGADVPGKLALREEHLFWQADEPLPIGTELEVAAGVPNAPAAPVANLVVAGVPPSLMPELAFQEWIDFRRGVGDSVSCTVNSTGSCGSNGIRTIELPSGEEALEAVNVAWTFPVPVHGFFDYEAHVELPSGAVAPGFGEPVGRTRLFAAPADGTLPMGTLVFPKGTIEHCGVLVVRDIRTGLEQRSELCEDAEAPVAVERDTPLARCSTPPTPSNPELTKAWCELHAGDASCQPGGGGAAGSPGAGAAGSAGGGMAGSPALPDDRPGEGNSAAPDIERKRSSSACQLTAVGSPSGGVALLFGLAALTAWRRRRAGRPESEN